MFGLKRVMVTTFQAVSGAGYPGVPSLDILGNVIPYIGGDEEKKVEAETPKLSDARFSPRCVSNVPMRCVSWMRRAASGSLMGDFFQSVDLSRK